MPGVKDFHDFENVSLSPLFHIYSLYIGVDPYTKTFGCSSNTERLTIKARRTFMHYGS